MHAMEGLAHPVDELILEEHAPDLMQHSPEELKPLQSFVQQHCKKLDVDTSRWSQTSSQEFRV
jgi:hypothetical protein